MRVISAVAAAVALSLATPALAQEEWDNIKFPEDGFEVNFPGKPKVETTTWVSQYRYNLPAKVYSATHGRERYSVTIVDYRVLPKMGEERAKQCPAGAETCIGTQDGRRGGIIGLGYWKMDVRGALAFAALKFVQRPGAKVTDMNLQFEQVVEGLFMQLTNGDESRTFGYVTMHENRLYIFEGTVPKGMPEPGLFQGSVGFVDAKGGSIRYTDYYSNAIHGLRQQEPPSFRVDGGPPQTWPPSAAITDENHAGGMDSPALDAPAPGAGAGRGRGAGAGAGAPAGTGRY
ncbi:MAG TPA: hypothetical protein VGJ78_04260 [Vicinamibacterales bacterium]